MNILSATGVTAGAAIAPRHSARPPGRRARRTTLTGVALAGLAASFLVNPGVASAAPPPTDLPTFPDNIVAFPDRDFISLEGFAGAVTVEVWRGDTLMGAATGAGPDMEINHPGGRCWGWGADGKQDPDFPAVTPDLDTGDRVIVWQVQSGTRVALAETTIQAPRASKVNYTPGSATFTVSGTLSAGFDPEKLEQRIVNPELTDTAVARRDVRAVYDPDAPTAMAPAAKGGYSSRLEVSGTTFTAYYDFSASADPATPADEAADVAAIAATTDVQRALSWQVTDADANRQGLTIAENGELGGPGFGGCPQGPGNSTVNAGQFSAVWASDGTTAQLNWSPAAAQPGGAPVTGYSVEAVQTTGTAGEQKVVGMRTGAGATRTTLSGLTGGSAAWKIEVRALSTDALSAPFPPASGTPAGPTTGDTKAPTITATQNQTTGAVSFSADEPNVDIYYTTVGSDPLVDQSGLPTQTATLFRTPLPVTASTSFKVVGFDLAGNTSDITSASFGPVAAPAASAPGVPVNLIATPGNAKIDLRWTAPANTGTRPITGYTVTGTAPAATGVNAFSTTVASPTPNASFSGLTNGREYTFRVTATNDSNMTSEPSAPLTARPGDTVTITRALWKSRDFRLEGTGSVAGSTLTVRIGNPTTGAIIPGATATVADDPATAAVDLVWSIRLRNGVPASNPGTIWVISSGGGQATRVVTNG